MAGEDRSRPRASQQDFKVTLNFPEALQKGQPAEATFTYDGKLSGRKIAGLWHQVRGDPERPRVPDVPGALVSGQRLHRRTASRPT